MKAEKLRDLGLQELRQRERDLKKEVFNLRFRHRMGEIENPMKLREIRREIARIKTIMVEKI